MLSCKFDLTDLVESSCYVDCESCRRVNHLSNGYVHSLVGTKRGFDSTTLDQNRERSLKDYS